MAIGGQSRTDWAERGLNGTGKIGDGRERGLVAGGNDGNVAAAGADGIALRLVLVWAGRRIRGVGGEGVVGNEMPESVVEIGGVGCESCSRARVGEAERGFCGQDRQGVEG